MSALPAPLFQHEGWHYFASHDNPLLWYLVPGAPALDPPALQAMGQQTRLAVSARWLAADDSRLAMLADAIREVHGLQGEVLLQPVAPPLVELEGMALLLDEGDGRQRTLAHSGTSGFAPWDALFSVMLDAPAAALAREALEQGRSGRLMLAVRYALRLPMSASARLAGRIPAPAASLVSELDDSNIPEVAAGLLDEALAQGTLRLQVDSILPQDAALVRDACADVRGQALMLAEHHLHAQAAAWRAHRAAAERAAKDGKRGLSKMFSPTEAPKPPAFTARPLDLEAESSQTGSVRIPPQQTGTEPSWLSATTDLGAWTAQRRSTH